MTAVNERRTLGSANVTSLLGASLPRSFLFSGALSSDL